MEQFTIQNVIQEKLQTLKVDLYEDNLYKKTCVLFDIWTKQKELGLLFDLYSAIEEDRIVNVGPTTFFKDNENYKDQYIKFLLNNNLIFLHEVNDPVVLINLIYYWLLVEVKHDKKILNDI